MISLSSLRGSKRQTPKPVTSPANLAERFLEVQRLRKQVRELEHSADMDRQDDAASRSEDQRPKNESEQP
jgi:hypothetical protein